MPTYSLRDAPTRFGGLDGEAARRHDALGQLIDYCRQHDPQRLRNLIEIGRIEEYCAKQVKLEEAVTRQLLSGQLCATGVLPGALTKSPIEPESWRVLKPSYENSRATAHDGRVIVDILVVPGETLISTGAPGKPSGMPLILTEFDRRQKDGTAFADFATEAKTLELWYKSEHPTAPNLTLKTIQNRLREPWRNNLKLSPKL